MREREGEGGREGGRGREGMGREGRREGTEGEEGRERAGGYLSTLSPQTQSVPWVDTHPAHPSLLLLSSPS